MSSLWAWALGGITVVGLGVLIVFAVKSDNEWDAGCRAQGGHVASHTSVSTGVGVGANGKVTPVVTTDTTSYCLKDGRILDIR